jgi:hypothetical protein
MHQNNQRSVATALAILPTRQSNRDALESFFPHMRGLYGIQGDDEGSELLRQRSLGAADLVFLLG